MKDVSIATFVIQFEKVYGSILTNKALFVKVYNQYLDKGGWRTKVEVGKEKYGNLIQPIYKYVYTKWGRWDWKAYESFVRIANHTRTQHHEGITQKMQKAISVLPKNIINKVLTHEEV